MLLPQLLGLRQHLVGARSHANVLCEIDPTHHPRGVHQELCRAGDVVPLRSDTHMEQVITTDHFSFWIGKNREGVTGLLAEISRDLGRINADRNRSDTGGLKLG